MSGGVLPINDLVGTNQGNLVNTGIPANTALGMSDSFANVVSGGQINTLSGTNNQVFAGNA